MLRALSDLATDRPRRSSSPPSAPSWSQPPSGARGGPAQSHRGGDQALVSHDDLHARVGVAEA
jgi:hypothetical protein